MTVTSTVSTSFAVARLAAKEPSVFSRFGACCSHRLGPIHRNQYHLRVICLKVREKTNTSLRKMTTRL